MNSRTLFAIGVMALGLVAQAGAQQYEASGGSAKTLREATLKAIQTNPEVQERWHAYLASDRERSAARGNYLPRVDVSASIGNEDYTFTPDDGSGEVSGTFKPQGVNLTITQLIYDGFATPREVRRLGHIRVTRYFQLLEKAEEISLETYRAYEDVLRYRELVGYAEDNMNLHQQIYDQIQDRVEAGVGRQVDFEQAKGRLALAKSNLVSEQSNLHDVSARYQRIVGELPAEDLEPVAPLKAEMPLDVNTALSFAYQESPTLNAAAEAIRAARTDVSVHRSAYLPRMDLRLRGTYGDELDRQFGSSEDTVAELVFSYNLFNGGSDRATVRQYIEEGHRAEDLRIKACRDVRQTLKISYNDVIRLGEQLEYLGQHESSIEKARKAYRNQFNIGQRTLLDLLDTENEYFEARRAYANGQHNYQLAHARTLAAMGRLMSAMDVRRSDMPSLADLRSGTDDGGAAVPCPPEPMHDAPTPVVDVDQDNVDDAIDLCIDSPTGSAVNAAGCPEAEPIILQGVNFEFNKARLTPDSQATLDKVVAILLGEPSVKVHVGGHTDSIGSAAYNLDLSRRRAQAVVDYLSAHGVDTQRMTSAGYGEDRPIASNDTSEGRAENRRVELDVLEEEKAPAAEAATPMN